MGRSIERLPSRVTGGRTLEVGCCSSARFSRLSGQAHRPHLGAGCAERDRGTRVPALQAIALRYTAHAQHTLHRYRVRTSSLTDIENALIYVSGSCQAVVGQSMTSFHNWVASEAPPADRRRVSLFGFCHSPAFFFATAGGRATSQGLSRPLLKRTRVLVIRNVTAAFQPSSEECNTTRDLLLSNRFLTR